MFNSESLKKLFQETNATVCEIEREIISVFGEYISNQALRGYINTTESPRLINPRADKLELLSKYLTYKLGRVISIDSFFDIDYTNKRK